MADPLDDLFWRDELLQILFWYEGEGFGTDAAASDLRPFLGVEVAVVEHHLERLVAAGFASRGGETPLRYRLSEAGRAEGARRFADEFAGLTGQAHMECNDPNCACKTLGPQACANRQPHSH